LLRQYVPKGTPLSEFGQSDLDAVADSLNDRPRKTLDFATPGEHFRILLAGLASQQVEPTRGVRSETRIRPAIGSNKSSLPKLRLSASIKSLFADHLKLISDMGPRKTILHQSTRCSSYAGTC
jgi:hypothetical protein